MKIAWQYRTARWIVILLGIAVAALAFYWSMSKAWPDVGSGDDLARIAVAVFAVMGFTLIELVWLGLWLATTETQPVESSDQAKPEQAEAVPVSYDAVCPHCGKGLAVVLVVPPKPGDHPVVFKASTQVVTESS